MNYLPIENRSKKKKNSLFAIFFLAVFLLTVLDLTGFDFLPRFLYKAGSPLWRVERLWDDSFGGFFYAFESKENIVRENEMLRNQLASARQEIFLSEEARKQNMEMKELLGRSDAEKIIFGTVIKSPPASPYDILIIDVGRNHGLASGDKVVTSGGSVLGELSDVYESHSRVDLYSSPGRELAMFLGESRVAVAGIGVGGGVFEVILPKEVIVEIGEPVYFASTEPVLIGLVNNIFTQDVDFLKLVQVSGMVNIYELRYVGVITSATGIKFEN